jgi:two-component system OmpR family sensor kinase
LIALLIVAVAGTVAALLVAGLPADWRVASALGAVLAAGAAAIGTPLLARARQELDAAQRLLESTAGELAAANDDLRRTAEARDRALSDLRAAAEERQLFLNSIAHEVNSPLTVIQGHVQLIAAKLERDGVPDRDQLVRGITRIDAGVRRLTALVEEFLWVARLDIDEPVGLDRRPTDLIALVRGIVEDQSTTTTRHRIRMESLRDRLVGQWDPRRLRQAVGNLVANAIKFSPGGGDILVSVATERGDSVAVVTVLDEGIGISAAELPHIFDRFYRGEQAKHLAAGTGLGLAAVKHAVEAHGGTVSVRSQPGSGATFLLRLPIEPTSDVPEAPVLEPGQDRSDGESSADR